MRKGFFLPVLWALKRSGLETNEGRWTMDVTERNNGRAWRAKEDGLIAGCVGGINAI
jgi:hypothetical protein